jgi:hypothetical protein
VGRQPAPELVQRGERRPAALQVVRGRPSLCQNSSKPAAAAAASSSPQRVSFSAANCP